ncbi:WxL domain-containing protein [Carnobacterium maltaromaticum]|uniref:WxL domain-containing protein n=1 Tax=Carnobacterium maltaromaticum TaxID=2751 RepID=UPI00191B994C|nr:WxL domain-containing protein [Carnobacterium maltaromaticum]CAD5903090.1 conserved exported hypothetical protein [Carnobacterium maltaromaticum]
MKNKIFSTMLIGLLASPLIQVEAADSVDPDPAVSTGEVTFTGDSATITPPVDPTDPDIVDPDPENPGTGNYGPLSIDFVSNLNFATVEIKGVETSYYATNKNPHIQVTDTRGTDEGWRLTAQMSKFLAEDDSELIGSTLSLLNGDIRTQSNNISAPPVGNKGINLIPDGDVIEVMSAAAESGRGTWVQVFAGATDAALIVPGGAALAKTYTSTIDWQLANTPD